MAARTTSARKLEISYYKDEVLLILAVRITVTVIHNSLQMQQQYWWLTLWVLTP
jgi:hypothetical protein